MAVEKGIEKKIKDLGLINFSANENLSPELIDDAIESTTTFYKNINIADLADRVKKNKAAHSAVRT
ncbi:hypothetical protein AGMMS50230_19350 [Spirochaetia bacterium]|nr:hypothetical protein AGMMS50230_19350 [Spirochaetia bacterium]